MAKVAVDPRRIDKASRLIHASPEAIYRALVDSEAVATWLPPDGMRGIVHDFEPRSGGRLAMTLVYENAHPDTQGKSSEDTDTIDGRFIELIEDELIAWDIDFVSDDPAYAGTMRMTWRLSVAPNGTEISVEATNVPVGISPEDHAVGLGSTLENLAIFVQASGTHSET